MSVGVVLPLGVDDTNFQIPSTLVADGGVPVELLEPVGPPPQAESNSANATTTSFTALLELLRRPIDISDSI